MDVPRACFALFSLSSCTSKVITLINVPYYWTFHSVVDFIICCHNIEFNIVEVMNLHLFCVLPPSGKARNSSFLR
jgi:hypothetical protein